MDALLLCLSFIALSIGTYSIWPSRWNVVAHVNLGFCIVAYVIPIYLTNGLREFQPALVHFCSLLILAGAVTYLMGLRVGCLGRPLAHAPLRLSFHRLSKAEYQRVFLRLTLVIAVVSLIGMAASFAAMGFVPAFARDPFAAKNFRGVYAAPYHHVEWLYRASFFALVAVMPLALASWVTTRRLLWAVVTGACLILIGLTLSRSSLAGGVLLVLGLVAAYRRKWTVAFLAFVVLIFPFGAAANHLVGIVRGYRVDLWQVIANGSPDVTDCLNFMFHFLGHPAFTHGRTFFGGLVPNRHEWNPSVYSLMVVNHGGDVNRIISGGLRLPAPVWGYTAFGWAGAVAVPFVSGWIQARFIAFVRREGEGAPIQQAAAVYLFYSAAGIAISQFYVLSLYAVPASFIYFCYLYTPGLNAAVDGRSKIAAAFSKPRTGTGCEA